MDPNATLQEIRQLNKTHGTYGLDADETFRLVELVEGLDNWLTSGGFLPAPWTATHRPKS